MGVEYGGTWFRSHLEARWAAFFDMAGVEWEYEPRDAMAPGWLPDFRVKGIRIQDKPYSALVEVKPVKLSWYVVHDDFGKALSDRWALLLGGEPEGDYVGFLACRRDGGYRSIPIRLTDIGLEAGPPDRQDYGGHAEALFMRAREQVVPLSPFRLAVSRLPAPAQEYARKAAQIPDAEKF